MHDYMWKYIFTLCEETCGSICSWHSEDCETLGADWPGGASKENTWWLAELQVDVEGGNMDWRPSFSLLDRGWEMEVGQWEISGLENEEVGSWETLEAATGTLLPILISMAPPLWAAAMSSFNPDRIPVGLAIGSCDIIRCLLSGASLWILRDSMWASSTQSASVTSTV